MRFFGSLIMSGVFALGVSAQNANLTAIHGIPGLPKAVDVFVNDSKLFDFNFGETKGPLSLKPGTYKVEIKLDNKTVLSASPTLMAGTDYTVIAHLKEKSGIQLSLFTNDLAKIDPSKSRLVVRHTAMAPAVDVLVRTNSSQPYAALIKNLSNPNQASADVAATSYQVALAGAGTTKVAFGPANVTLMANNYYAVYAIGELGKPSFRLFIQNIDLNKQSPLMGMVRGKACGGAIAISTMSPAYDKDFQISMTGGTQNGMAMLHGGHSDSQFLTQKLPLALGALGLNGCTLYQNTEVIVVMMLDATGAASKTIKVPGFIAPTFEEYHFQFSFLAPKANSVGILLTDYASVEAR